MSDKLRVVPASEVRRLRELSPNEKLQEQKRLAQEDLELECAIRRLEFPTVVQEVNRRIQERAVRTGGDRNSQAFVIDWLMIMGMVGFEMSYLPRPYDELVELFTEAGYRVSLSFCFRADPSQGVYLILE